MAGKESDFQAMVRLGGEKLAREQANKPSTTLQAAPSASVAAQSSPTAENVSEDAMQLAAENKRLKSMLAEWNSGLSLRTTFSNSFAKFVACREWQASHGKLPASAKAPSDPATASYEAEWDRNDNNCQEKSGWIKANYIRFRKYQAEKATK